jgi:hypothetical protein
MLALVIQQCKITDPARPGRRAQRAGEESEAKYGEAECFHGSFLNHSGVGNILLNISIF